MNTSYIVHDNVPHEIFENAAEMFTYLNDCPNELLVFYVNLFQTTTNTTQLLIAMTNILKTSEYTHKQLSQQIFKKLMEIVNLQNYETIQKLTEGKFDTNFTFQKVLDKSGFIIPTSLIIDYVNLLLHFVFRFE